MELMKMKQKDIEIFLSTIQTFINPKIQLEQYQIPARLAAMIGWRAYQLGDVQDKIIADYCTGTGSFALAAALLGAEEVIGIDIDPDAIKIAKTNAEKANLSIKWVIGDIKGIERDFDTIFMNSPFGIQGNKKDQYFLQYALEHTNVCYSMHLYQQKNLEFLEGFITSLDKKVDEKIIAEFEIPKTYYFHKKRYHVIKTLVLRIINK